MKNFACYAIETNKQMENRLKFITHSVQLWRGLRRREWGKGRARDRERKRGRLSWLSYLSKWSMKTALGQTEASATWSGNVRWKTQCSWKCRWKSCWNCCKVKVATSCNCALHHSHNCRDLEAIQTNPASPSVSLHVSQPLYLFLCLSLCLSLCTSVYLPLSVCLLALTAT